MNRLAVVILLGLVVVACADTDPARTDLDEHKVLLEVSERLVYVMPDQFPNVIAFCDGPARIYITTRERQNPVVVMDHPECGPG